MGRLRVGLFFGSFNPIHIGHLIMANHLLEHTDMNELWLVVTPQNPFKKKASLLDNHHRLEMVYRALQDYDRIRPCDIEFRLPQPNYTVNTLAHLQERYPNYDFSLVMGEDNLRSFHRWKNYEVILERHAIYVYPRIKQENESDAREFPQANIRRIQAPIVGISATYVRQQIKEGKSVRPLLHPQVWKYIDEMGFYLK